MDGLPSEAAVLSFLRVGVILFAAAAAVGLWRRASLWRRGCPAQVDVWSGLAALPRRYLRDVHDVVAREPLAARMHALAAGGFIVAGLLFLVDLALGRPAWLQPPGMLAAAAMAAGSAIASWRRFSANQPCKTFPGRMEPLRRDARDLGSRAPGLVRSVTRRRLLSTHADVGRGHPRWWCRDRSRSSCRRSHPACAGRALNLAFHPRPARFGSTRPSVGLPPVDLDAERLGAAAAADLGWNRLLNVDACVQCGRCEEACPAFAAGQPLNPKALIYDLASGPLSPRSWGPMRGRHIPVASLQLQHRVRQRLISRRSSIPRRSGAAPAAVPASAPVR